MAKHRAKKTRRRTASTSAIGVAAVAVAGAAVLGATPTLATGPDLLAALHYLRGTNIGTIPTDEQFTDFIDEVLVGADVVQPEQPYQKVPYNAGFRPFSRGGFRDLTYDASVAQGVELLTGQNPAPGDVIFGFSQGAVAASAYKGQHTGNTYILVANPGRANGGVLQRFKGIKLPLIDVSFTGATPNNGDFTIDVARQYDGWADFPTYLWNPVAVANALMGIALVHGDTQFELTAEDLEAAREAGSDYYQFDDDSNTAYYVIRTYPVPLLMPLQSFLPAPVIAALDAPLRAFIETAYDRSDYSEPTRASLFKPLWPRKVEPAAEASTASVDSPAPEMDALDDTLDDDAARRQAETPEPAETHAPAATSELIGVDEADEAADPRQDVPEPETAADSDESGAAQESDAPERRHADRDRQQRRGGADQSRRDRSDAA
ncbi:PE-PPE domain-containing protein [Mycolicibacterium duvalii]|uniref:PE-PPE domain-containing protein n=1 Tax=Mycolicibacterium duvalii TaxID=39688 RepID=A0A7I7K593_9MYCO|nr:PE-PPE domain-containing protein [Mycolicibacterium duvalii]MCV7367672.1 PE-PPE domain-containing protein [Mycolicibacterium duvalii]PEG35100.1 PE-PPE domain-containing protein [Mycolicibacterium duvalii]BBX18738.1 hypothetical protein MDUV_35980 [Mycolicibacterium duvalii]